MCSGSKAGSYLRLIDFVNHSTLGLRVIKKKKRLRPEAAYQPPPVQSHPPLTPAPASVRFGLFFFFFFILSSLELSDTKVYEP